MSELSYSTVYMMVDVLLVYAAWETAPSLPVYIRINLFCSNQQVRPPADCGLRYVTHLLPLSYFLYRTTKERKTEEASTDELSIALIKEVRLILLLKNVCMVSCLSIKETAQKLISNWSLSLYRSNQQRR